ncbi:uncharacterized protein plekhg6 [Electrophorus electricus]|uniref:uncharacterized protein plekhg6 n=1 Tax=Electrophorus electricus TaxID=8005 RepID=UPI0015CFC575|nr:uncharacterized protein plekhg6 [Electrophorus electricus]
MTQLPDKDNLNAQEMDAELENQKEAEKESDIDRNLAQVAETPKNHKRTANKQKYHTVGNQKKKQRQAVGFSTVSKGTNANAKTRGALVPATFIQGSSEKMSVLEERGGAAGGQDVMEVLKRTLETFPVPAELSWSWREDGRVEVLEPSWADIVCCSESMSKIQRHQQEAMWEFIHTEIIYINKLTIVTDLVLAALEYVHHRGFLNEVSSAQLFSNLPSILDAHRLFWQEVIYPILQGTRLTGQPFDPLKLEPGCLQFPERFSVYLDYCWEEEKNVEFTRNQLETNPHFHIFVLWVETHPQCRRMRLGDMQAKPHQRITKYPLLLKAILKTTQDPPTQHALQRMLSSVTQFLDSINDYLQFKDDEMDLFDLSQRIEGYELQGMGDEIDKHIQEFCHFDLTSPVRGSGPKAIRKLLLEEPLKVRGRKDSKLEVNVLLFTDVLLLTKAQKKTDKQKVVHPPLELERIHCAELKDGYSFVLVEVSDLGCPVSVYTVSAPSPEKCTVWVSAINQTQEDLKTLRKKDITKPQEPSDQVELEGSETLLSPSTQTTKDTEEQPDEITLSQVKAGLPYTGNQLEIEEIPQVGKKDQYLHTEPVQVNHFGIEMPNIPKKLNEEAAQESEEREVGKNENFEDSFIGLRNERQVTWTHRTLSPINSNDISQRDLESLQDSGHRQSGEENELLTNSGRFCRKLISPRLRKKRPINSQSCAPPQDSRMMPGETRLSKSITNMNSFSNSDSDGNHSISQSPNSSSTSQDSHLVLKLGSIKQNRVALWNEKLSPETQTLSDPELPKETPHQNSLKEPKVKSHRSSSIPEVIYSGAHSLPLSVPEPSPSPPPRLDPQQYPSPLQGLLARAKERERGRGITKREGKPAGKSASSVPNVICAPSTPSPSTSEGEQEVEAEALEAFKPQLSSSSYRVKKRSMYDSEKERRNSFGLVTPVGASVDWSGWCFDDEEVLEFLGPDNERLAWVDKALSADEPQEAPGEGEYSEV